MGLGHLGQKMMFFPIIYIGKKMREKISGKTVFSAPNAPEGQQNPPLLKKSVDKRPKEFVEKAVPSVPEDWRDAEALRRQATFWRWESGS